MTTLLHTVHVTNLTPGVSATTLRAGARSHEAQKDKAHVHRLIYGDSFVAIGVYDAATVDVDPKAGLALFTN